ncbi:hypothetical protein [Caballeronia telluris]|uniref:Holin n=1 Tax=Caballeronia telluris TaxID=326475 RepID=A0A158G084_9BURK|nr:hypothetical protein [Caballeronia telluris]SAL25485.1 hypothetical protein AWB66_01462 [Caballeronia telluris]
MQLGQYSKQLSVAGLLLLWLLLDVLKIDDAQLKYAVMTLVGVITGWHGITNLPLKTSQQ